jgi:hypothetical protein
MAAEDAITITKPTWGDAEPGSPSLPKDGFGIYFTLRPARNKNGPTVAFLGAYRLAGHYGDVYGGRIRGALKIVAINPTTGQVYVNNAERPHSTPLDNITDPRPKGEDDAERVSVEAHFNVDLCVQLGLPPDKAVYSVFVWLDETTSEVKTLDLEENKARSGIAAPRAADAGSRLIDFRKSPASPPPADATIALAWSTAKVEHEEDSGTRIYGCVGPSLLPAKSLRADERAKLVLMSLNYEDRRFESRSFAFPEPVLASKEGYFDLDLLGAGRFPKPIKKAFVTACVGNTLSKVLLVKPRS